MSFAACIEEALKERKFGPKKQEEILDKWQNIRDEYIADGYDVSRAERMAAEEAVVRHDIDVKERKKRKLAHAMKEMAVDQRISEYDGGTDQLWRVAEAFLEMDDKAPWTDYATMNDRVRGQAHGMLADLVNKYGNKGLGIRRNTVGLKNVLDEIFDPGSSGDGSAAVMARAWDDTVDFLVRRFNSAGGTLMRRRDWRLPQKQSRFKLTNESQWVNDHMEWLDWNAMRTPDGRRIPENKRAEVLKGVFDTLRTNGHIKPKKTTYAGRAIGNKLDQSRFLIYKDSDSWMAMHKAYGDGTVFDTMMAHVDTMAHQIAMIETYGPNPALMHEVIKQKILNRVAQNDSGVALTAKAENKLKRADNMFKVVNRETSLPDANHFGMFMAGTRSILTSAYLGSASVVAIPGDLFTSALTSRFNKLPATKTLGQYLKMMNPVDAGDRTIAIRSGLIAETATQMAYAQARFNATDSYGPALARQISDVVMRASLMAPHTQAARWAFQMELMGTMAENMGKSLDELPFAEMFRRNGITDNDWNTLRSIAPYEHKGAKFLRPDDLYDAGLDDLAAQQVADRFMSMILKEGKFAVPDASIRGLVTLRGATQSGTFIGELANSFAMFKNFPITLMFTHMRRGLIQDSMGGRIKYLATMAAGMTGVGALSIQMRQLSQGKEPRDMDNSEFWGSAMLAGGGLAIWGDFLFSDVNRFGGGLSQTLAGPVGQFVNDFRNLTVGNIMEAVQGEETKFGAELVRFAKRNTPGTSIWWGRLLLERELWNRLEEYADPKIESKRRRYETKMEKDYKQGYLIPPGERIFTPQ